MGGPGSVEKTGGGTTAGVDRPAKILIIDDEPDTVVFLETYLEDQGYHTCSAMDGEQGLAMLKAEAPDLVLMDLRMPRRTGMQLYREIWSQRPLQNIPIIFISGLPDVKIFDNSCTPLPEPAARLDKPINLEQLQDAVTAALKRVPGVK